MIHSKLAPFPPLVHFKDVLKANSETEKQVSAGLSVSHPDIEYQPANYPKKKSENTRTLKALPPPCQPTILTSYLLALWKKRMN